MYLPESLFDILDIAIRKSLLQHIPFGFLHGVFCKFSFPSGNMGEFDSRNGMLFPNGNKCLS
jgi:hypothetical protein